MVMRVRKGLIRRYRARADRRAVLVSITAAGRLVVDQATARRRELIAEILAQLPQDLQQAVADALAAFAEAAGEVPDSQWPPVTPEGPQADSAPVSRPRAAREPTRAGKQAPADATGRS